MLDLSRLEAGAWQPQMDWCDIEEILGTALDRLPDAAANRVVVRAPKQLPLIRADYTQIALVLTNLLENAVKYAPGQTDIEVSIEYSPRGEQSHELRIKMRDFGQGLAKGEEERVFERFFRGASHAQSQVHGTGLGLALCRAIVRVHGGAIWASNAPPGEPHGAVFCFTLRADIDE
jgi:two-component system sensor histidine kinase KdpD